MWSVGLTSWETVMAAPGGFSRGLPLPGSVVYEAVPQETELTVLMGYSDGLVSVGKTYLPAQVSSGELRAAPTPKPHEEGRGADTGLVTLDAAPCQPVPLSLNVSTESMLVKCFKYAITQFIILPTSIFSSVE